MNFAVDPESLDMNVRVPIGTPVFSSCWAVMIGPMVFVWRWLAKFSKDLCTVQYPPRANTATSAHIHLGCSLIQLENDPMYSLQVHYALLTFG